MEQGWKTGLGYERRGGGRERKTKSSGKKDQERGGQVEKEREILVLNENGKLGDGGP